jgi:hypothetical protein
VFPSPNKIDFHYVFDADIRNNPLALIAVSTVFGIYLVLLLNARRRDRKDSEKVRHLIHTAFGIRAYLVFFPAIFKAQFPQSGCKLKQRKNGLG